MFWKAQQKGSYIFWFYVSQDFNCKTVNTYDFFQLSRNSISWFCSNKNQLRKKTSSPTKLRIPGLLLVKNKVILVNLWNYKNESCKNAFTFCKSYDDGLAISVWFLPDNIDFVLKPRWKNWKLKMTVSYWNIQLFNFLKF